MVETKGRHIGRGWVVAPVLLATALASTSAVASAGPPIPPVDPLAAAIVAGSPSSGPTAGASTPPRSPSAPPSASSDACEEPFTYFEQEEMIPGEIVSVQISGFASGSLVEILFAVSDSIDDSVSVGEVVVDTSGQASTTFRVPSDASFGLHELGFVGPGCAAYGYILVVPSLPELTVDDATLTPGQRTTLRGGGFDPKTRVSAHLDCRPDDPIEPCSTLTVGRTDGAGTVVLAVRIPRHVEPGRHRLVVYGADTEGDDRVLGVSITVGPGPTLPPTDAD